MKLNKKSKDVIRKEIEEMLKDVPEGKRIKLDKDILEELLFETDYSVEHNINVKFIVWNGDFLSKIDLSEVSFENVCLDIAYSQTDAFDFMTSPVDYYEGMEEINLSNTNINLDFSKLYYVGGYESEESFVTLIGVNLENVDLSKCDTSNVLWFANVNLSGTNIKVTPRTEGFPLNFNKVNLTGIDLSKFNIGCKNFCDSMYLDSYAFDYAWDNSNKEQSRILFCDCNLKNTKINIEFNEDCNNIYVSREVNRDEKEYTESAQENFYSMLNEGKLEGCYLNGKLVKPRKRTDEERKINKERILEEYAEFEKKYYDSIISSVDEEVKKSRK